MKKERLSVVLISTFIIIVFACGSIQNESKKSSSKDEIFVADTTYTAICGDTLKQVDTIISDFHIKYLMVEANEKVIKQGTDWQGTNLLIEYCDAYVDLSISYDTINVLPKLTLVKEYFDDIIPEKEIQRLTISNFYIMQISDSEVQFKINICIPDTSDCYQIYITVTQQGDITLKEREYEDSY